MAGTAMREPSVRCDARCTVFSVLPFSLVQVALSYLPLLLFLSTSTALYPPPPPPPAKSARLSWLRDRVPSQVAMVDNSHGCLNPSPFGKQQPTIRGTNVFLFAGLGTP